MTLAGTPLALLRLHQLVCIGSRMVNMLTAPGLTLLFLGVVVGLGTAFVWMLWEIEQTSRPHRDGDRVN
jgi:hypothetical protein